MPLLVLASISILFPYRLPFHLGTLEIVALIIMGSGFSYVFYAASKPLWLKMLTTAVAFACAPLLLAEFKHPLLGVLWFCFLGYVTACALVWYQNIVSYRHSLYILVSIFISVTLIGALSMYYLSR